MCLGLCLLLAALVMTGKPCAATLCYRNPTFPHFAILQCCLPSGVFAYLAHGKLVARDCRFLMRLCDPASTDCCSCIKMATSREQAPNQLEIEAAAAVEEFTPYVERLAISEKLVRTSGLMFLNLVTREKNTYCVELTQKGWRITSKNLESMNGDYRTPELHQVYYDTMGQLLGTMSPGYRQQFGNNLVEKLNDLSKGNQN
ncbi:hypothetical protein L596_027738 [Steinernema carpocapsae]|uniref:GSKIP domain-containing protein n=1 Tax=Steinernema carpocapsae TaxID=34508 RepID=A0A4U5LWC0_STECR|nr:hypothetical protein L596_027738 [Steinernema carpocapsae]